MTLCLNCRESTNGPGMLVRLSACLMLIAVAGCWGSDEPRGLLSETVIAVLAEFGRTPRINSNSGRDHWGQVFSVALAGGGIQGGRILGRSDAQGAYPEDALVTPEDITATIYDQLGFEPHREVQDTTGRPLPISRRNVFHALL